MKFGRVLVTVLVALTLQLALARYAVGGRWVFDLVLVAVVYGALLWGPAAGMWIGTLGGLMQDALSEDVIGVGGFAKTVVGFGVGGLGLQFLVARPLARASVVAVATVLHRLIVVGLWATADQEWKGVAWTVLLMETGLNAAAGLAAFHLTQMLPGVIQHTRAGCRSPLSRRRW